MLDVFGVDWMFSKRLVCPPIGLKPEGLKVVLMLGLSADRGCENRLLPGEPIAKPGGYDWKEWMPGVLVLIELGVSDAASRSSLSSSFAFLVLRMEFPRSKGRCEGWKGVTDGVC